MDAVISGRAGKALLLGEGSLIAFDVNDPSRSVPMQEADLHFLFGEAQDIRIIENADLDQITRELERASNCATALDLTLIALDPELSHEIRFEAIEELEDLLCLDAAILEYLEHLIYGRPLPESADIAGALSCCTTVRVTHAHAMFQRIKDHQTSIREVSLAWDAIPVEAFGGYEQKEQFQRTAVSEGLFHALASTRETPATVSNFQITAGLKASIKAMSNHRQVIQYWIAPFRQPTRVFDIKYETDEQTELEAPAQRSQKGRRRRINRGAILRNVESQKQLIIEAMQHRDMVRVRNFVQELVEYQLKNGEPIHAAKSLCDLAAESKTLGLYSLQLELTEKSLQVKSDDARSWNQYADALLNSQRHFEALKAYEQAAAFGSGIVAKTGRAEVFKALGRLEDALEEYDLAVASYPENIFAKNGRAEILKSLGRLPDALTEYDAIIASYPEDVVARNGRSCVLAALGRYDEALESLTVRNPVTLQDWIGYHIRGMILLRMGKMDEAIQIFQRGANDDPLQPNRDYFQTALATALLRRQDFVKASNVLVAIKNPQLQSQANVLRLHSFGVLAQSEEASAAYERLLPKPWSIPDELIDELHRRYISKEEPRHDDDWVFDQEVRIMLLVANQQAMSSPTFSSYAN